MLVDKLILPTLQRPSGTDLVEGKDKIDLVLPGQTPAAHRRQRRSAATSTRRAASSKAARTATAA